VSGISSNLGSIDGATMLCKQRIFDTHMSAPKNRTKKRGWTREEAMQEARLYRSRYEFSVKSSAAYQYCRIKGFLDEACWHMKAVKTRRPRRWSVDDAYAEARKNNSTKELLANCSGAYHYLRQQGLLGDACSHMTGGNIRWTKETAIAEAEKYTGMMDFAKKSAGAFSYLRRHGLDDVVRKKMRARNGQ
jgi:hypothetical protein